MEKKKKKKKAKKEMTKKTAKKTTISCNKIVEDEEHTTRIMRSKHARYYPFLKSHRVGTRIIPPTVQWGG